MLAVLDPLIHCTGLGINPRLQATQASAVRFLTHCATVGTLTFYFKEEFSLCFFEFFGAASVPVGWTITAVLLEAAWPVAGKLCLRLEVKLLCSPTGSRVRSIPLVGHITVPYFPKGNCV